MTHPFGFDYARFYDDLRVEPTARNTGTKAPIFGAFRDGLYLYQFDDAIVTLEKEVFFTVQLPHTWREGTAISPHVHWTPLVAGSAGNVVRWGLEYSTAKIGSAFGASTTIYTATLDAGTITTQYSHCISAFNAITMTGDTISTMLVCRLFRNSSDASDTLAQTVGLLYVDFHYQVDAMGSLQEYIK